MSILISVKDTVDSTIERLDGQKFIADPIAGPELSRKKSILSSAYKRHGAIIETALTQSIGRLNGVEVFQTVPFRIGRSVSSFVQSHNLKTDAGFDACLGTSMLYQPDEDGEDYEIDILYHDMRSKKIVALEVKRGNGQFDRGKRDSLIKAALMVRMLLKSYADQRGWPVEAVESRILAYYGVPKFPSQIYLSGKEIDFFIGPGVHDRVEEVNQYFKQKLLDIVLGNLGQLRLAVS